MGFFFEVYWMNCSQICSIRRNETETVFNTGQIQGKGIGPNLEPSSALILLTALLQTDIFFTFVSTSIKQKRKLQQTALLVLPTTKTKTVASATAQSTNPCWFVFASEALHTSWRIVGERSIRKWDDAWLSHKMPRGRGCYPRAKAMKRWSAFATVEVGYWV